MQKRISHLDGLRAIAILWVVLFHVFGRWPNVVPYGARYAAFAVSGWLGVDLFFIISGFVILMTLEKCRGFGQFMVRRWLRLFPGMLLATLLVLATSPLLTARPAGRPAFVDTLPGLLFLPPMLLSRLGLPWNSLEGSFWSLYAEVAFYAVFGALFFLFGQRVAIAGLLAGFAVSVAIAVFAPHVPSPVYLLGLPYYGWFACGALYYLWWRAPLPASFVCASIVGIAAALAQPLDGSGRAPAPLLALLPVALFGVALVSPIVQRMLGWRPLLFMGAISYPFYLIHENMLVSMIVQLGQVAPWIPGMLLPVGPLIVVAVLAWLIAGFAEPRLRALLRRAIAAVPWPRRDAVALAPASLETERTEA